MQMFLRAEIGGGNLESPPARCAPADRFIPPLRNLPRTSMPARTLLPRPAHALLRTFGRIIIAVTAASAVLAAAPAPGRDASVEEIRAGFSHRSFLAKPATSLPLAEVGRRESSEGVRVRRTFPGLGNLRVMEVPEGENVSAAIARLRATGRYEYVEPDFVMTARATPNDPRYLSGEQWALRNFGQANGTAGADVRAEAAWDIQSAAPGVVVAVIDSGIRTTHEDLAANLWVNSGDGGVLGNNGRDDDRNGYIDDTHGFDSTRPVNTAGNGNPADSNGHGTAVAGVIGAVGNNGLGIAGVAWNVKIMSLRFIGPGGSGFVSDEIECIDYAIAKGAHLINASFGGSSYSQALFDAMKRARDASIIVVCSAGNDSDNNDVGSHYPSGFLLDNIVAVANTTRNDTLAASSAFGSGMVELGAPGTSILTAGHTADNEYRIMSGTSFSAPMVTGALALLKARFPQDSYRELINRLLRGVDRIPALAGKTITGGRLNISAALRSPSARPFNDDFSSPAVFSGEFGASRAGMQFASRETGEPAHGGAGGTGSVWWQWTAPRSGSVSFDTRGTGGDTLLAVYTGTALANLVQVSANDDESDSLRTSKVTFNAVSGTTYYLVVDMKGTPSGLAVLNSSLLASNDSFDGGRTVAGRSWSVRTDNRNATRESADPVIRSSRGAHSVWFRWRAPATRRYHLATYSSEFNTLLGVYTGDALGALNEIAAANTAGDSNALLNSAAVSFTATAGTLYHILVDSEASSSGVYAKGEFKLSCVDSEWEYFTIGDPGTVALAPDNTMRVSDEYGYMYAVETNGSRKWRYILTGFGTTSAPAVAADGSSYVADDLRYLHGVNADGSRRWRTQVSAVIRSSPAIARDGTVYARADDGRLHAFDPTSGFVKWSFSMGTATTATPSSPVVAPDGTIYCAGGDSRLYAISPDGVRRWSFSTDYMAGSPALAADGTIYIGTSAPTRRFFAIRPDGTLRWKYVVGGSVTTSAVVGPDGTVYFGSDDRKLYALNSAGELRWTYETGGEIGFTSPLVASDGSVGIGCDDGKIYWLESDGTLRRTYATAGEIASSPFLHNGRLYISSADSRLYSVDLGLVPASTSWPMHRQNPLRSGRQESRPLGIGVQPRNISSEVGETVSLTVGAVGGEPLAYQWFFNGQAIAGATSPTLKIDPVTHANRGQYSVRVSDPQSSVTSIAATLTVTTPLLPPVVATQPADTTVLTGERLRLQVVATGTDPISYQWFKDGARIAGATGPTFEIASARPTDRGGYSVTLTNLAGSLNSRTAAITVNPITRIANLSIRTRVSGTGLLTVGVTVGGDGVTGSKPLLLRAVGPTLREFGVNDASSDPQLKVFKGETTIAQNDNWSGSAEISAANGNVGAFGFVGAASKDAALLLSAAAGGYTVQIGAAEGADGVALAEVYDGTTGDDFTSRTPRLTNVSALSRVGPDGDVLIAGFSIAGSQAKTVLIRGIGPTLSAFGVGDTLADPRLEIYRSGTAVAEASNDNWRTAANAAAVAAAASRVGAFALPNDSLDACLLVSLPPGTYTAQISGLNGSAGTALVEVYEVP